MLTNLQGDLAFNPLRSAKKAVKKTVKVTAKVGRTAAKTGKTVARTTAKGAKASVRYVKKGVCMAAPLAAGAAGSNPDPRSQAAALAARAVANSSFCKGGQKFVEVEVPDVRACTFWDRIKKIFVDVPCQ
jgi:hypothetical protein